MAAADSPLFRFQLWRAALPPALRLLLTVNLATYLAYVVLALLAAFGVPALAVVDWLTLPANPQAVLARPWTPLTYGFVNAFGGFFGLISFVFGFYWLQWMGRDYEENHGAHRLFGLYVLGALGGALVGLALGAVLPSPRGVYFGLWTPVTAVLCAVATLHPDRQIGLFLLGVVSMKWIAIGFVVLSLVFSADLTVLGAALAGVLFARAQRAGRDPAAWAAPFFGARRSRSAPTPSRNPFKRSDPVATPAGRPSKRGASGASGTALTVDQILDKILEKGYESLTKEEREALDRASRD
ncbi:rhomboid family intramembrane serine protease [Rubrivirga sp.]|uniref:rhomboid family intramembrane serine protease n=1 Tax=Rubrivirga sp. TaxID=1885344 RepID=UPI003B51C4B0